MKEYVKRERELKEKGNSKRRRGHLLERIDGAKVRPTPMNMYEWQRCDNMDRRANDNTNAPLSMAQLHRNKKTAHGLLKPVLWILFDDNDDDDDNDNNKSDVPYAHSYTMPSK